MPFPGGALTTLLYTLRTRKSAILVIGLFVLCYLIPLGLRPVSTPDESRYAEIPREMITSGDWVVPHIDGVRYFEKPVLGYWLTAASMRLFGENAFAMRFPSALATGLAALLIFILVQWFIGGYAAMLAVMVFLTCFEVFGIGTLNVLDSMFAMFVTAAMTSFFFAHTAGHSIWKKRVLLLLFGLFCGLAFLTKGFPAFAIPFVTIVPFMIWERRWKELFVIPWLPLAAAALVVAPWAVMIHMREPDFWHFFIWNEHIRRFLSDDAQHGKSYLFLFIVFPAAALPWTALFPAVVSGIRKSGLRNALTRYALCWFILPFLFFSASRGKLLTYILPCFAPLAILIAMGLRNYMKHDGKKAFTIGAVALALFIGLLAVALSVVQLADFNGFKPYVWTWKWVLVVFGLLTFSILLLLAARESDHKKKYLLYALAPVIVMLLSHFAMPDMSVKNKTLGEFLLRSSHKIRPDTILVSEANPISAVCWFYKRSDVYQLENRGELKYGFGYDDSKHRLLELEQFKELVMQNSGKERVILVARLKKYESWKKRLPEPLFEDNNGGYVFARY